MNYDIQKLSITLEPASGEPERALVSIELALDASATTVRPGSRLQQMIECFSRPLEFDLTSERPGKKVDTLGDAFSTNWQCFTAMLVAALGRGASVPLQGLAHLPGWEGVKDDKSRSAILYRMVRQRKNNHYVVFVGMEEGSSFRLYAKSVVISATDEERLTAWLSLSHQTRNRKKPTTRASKRGEQSSPLLETTENPSPSLAEHSALDRYRRSVANSSSTSYFDLLMSLEPASGDRHRIAEHAKLWHTDSLHKMQFLISHIERAKKDIRVICYSLAAWKDQLEKSLKGFLRGGGRLRVLMLEPDSAGFLVKSAAEAAGEVERDHAPEQWQRVLEALRDSHRSDITSSRAMLYTWQQTFGTERLQCRSYQDTPNLYGFLIDDVTLYMSWYFIDPTERGFRLPALCADEREQSLHVDILRQMFRNWFDVMFGVGPDALAELNETAVV